MPEIDVDGCRIAFSVAGPEDAPVVLLSNALGTTRDLWCLQVRAFEAAFRVVRYDTRGHGQSDVPADGYTLDRLGRDALAVLDAVGAARAHVAGVSLGGLTAMWLGVHAPERVARLVLANTAARIGSREHWSTRIDEVRTAGLASVAEAAPARWFTTRFLDRKRDIAAAFRSMLCRTPTEGYIGCSGVLRDADLRDLVERIATPALVVTGIHDPVTTPDDAEFLRARIPGARCLRLDAAHFSNVEAADEFTSGVLDFLAA
jgi:3-oxoadipate enol-lactonase